MVERSGSRKIIVNYGWKSDNLAKTTITGIYVCERYLSIMMTMMIIIMNNSRRNPTRRSGFQWGPQEKNKKKDLEIGRLMHSARQLGTLIYEATLSYFF